MWLIISIINQSFLSKNVEQNKTVVVIELNNKLCRYLESKLNKTI